MRIKFGIATAIRSSLLLMLIVQTSESRPSLVVSEVNYDQVGVDQGEWVEILNLVDIENPTPLTYLVLYDGDVNGACQEYCRIDLSVLGFIPEGASIIIGAHPCAVLPLCSATDAIQNGAPDAIAIEVFGQIVDSVEYASDLVNSSCGFLQTVAADSDTVSGSIGLCYGGSWGFTENPTPCEPNECTVSDVPEFPAVVQAGWHLVKRLYRE